MKTTQRFMLTAVLGTLLAASSAAFGADAQAAKPKPDKMDTCPVSGEKLGEMGDAYVFTYEGQEVKLCCKHCRKDFDKDPAKYIKKIQDAAKKAEKPAAKQDKN